MANQIIISSTNLVITVDNLSDTEKIEYLAAMMKHCSKEQLREMWTRHCKSTKNGNKMLGDTPVASNSAFNYL